MRVLFNLSVGQTSGKDKLDWLGSDQRVEDLYGDVTVLNGCLARCFAR